MTESIPGGRRVPGGYTERMEEEQADEEQKRLGMTDAQWETWRRHTQGFGEQDENGVDLTALRRNLRLTAAQRLARLQQAVNSMPRRPRDARTCD